jgi:hypothetical protein
MTFEELKEFIERTECFVRWMREEKGEKVFLNVEPDSLFEFAALLGREFITENVPVGELYIDGSIWFDLSEICHSFGIHPEEITHKPLGFR